MGFGETEGLILFSKDFKEKDKLVKIFTESAGKQMFFVRGVHKRNSPLAAAILNFTQGTYFGELKTEGLSFLNGAKNVTALRKIQEDIFLAGYATYILNLVDAAIEDRVYDPHLYQFTKEALLMIDQGRDPEIITNIFEVQLLNRFGIALHWENCAVCQETKGRFDYSSKYNGVLCERHWSQDERRYHATPKSIHFLRMFAAISYEQIESIHLQAETKLEIRKTLDLIYDEYVGINLRSKKFIDQMHSWEGLLVNKQEDHENP
ncbi:MAG: DNA repair protein RecO [Enterococcus sp.]